MLEHGMYEDEVDEEAQLAVLEEICGLMDSLEERRLAGLGKPAGPARPASEDDDLAKLAAAAR